MEVLETLFSSRPRVKVLRAFLFQPGRELSARDVSDQTGVAASTARTHARDLAGIDFLHQGESGGDEDGQKRSVWKLNKSSKLREPLHQLILMHQDTDLDDIREELGGIGDVSKLIATGVLVGADNCPVDILIVGDNVDRRQLDRALSRIESSFGTELRYTLFSEEEFHYRENVFDKLIQDVTDSPHHVLIDSLNGSG